MGQVFISYAREDSITAEKLYEHLCRFREIHPWLDKKKLMPGTEWTSEISQAISESMIIIL